jgi:hypothetical protein
LLATDPAALTRVLGIAYRTISAHILGKAHLTRTTGATGAVTGLRRSAERVRFCSAEVGQAW